MRTPSPSSSREDAVSVMRPRVNRSKMPIYASPTSSWTCYYYWLPVEISWCLAQLGVQLCACRGESRCGRWVSGCHLLHPEYRRAERPVHRMHTRSYVLASKKDGMMFVDGLDDRAHDAV